MSSPNTLGMVRASDPASSQQAAEVVARHLTRAQSNVLKVFALSPHPITDKELLGLYRELFGACPESTPRKRRVELVGQGLIVQMGVKLDGDGKGEKCWRLS